MQWVTLRSGRLEDEFVLKKVSSLTVQRRDDFDHARVAGNARANRADIDNRVETIETAFTRRNGVLPPAANIVGINQVRSSEQPDSLRIESSHFLRREDIPRDQETLIVVAGDLFRFEFKSSQYAHLF